jgi:hypothetical protein
MINFVELAPINRGSVERELYSFVFSFAELASSVVITQLPPEYSISWQKLVFNMVIPGYFAIIYLSGDN